MRRALPSDSLMSISLCVFEIGLPRPLGQPAEISRGARDVFQDLCLESSRALEFLLITEPPQELNPDGARGRAGERAEQKGLDRQAVVAAERGPETDVGHRFPTAAAVEICGASHVHAALR